MLNRHHCWRPLGGGNAESLVPAVPPVLQLAGPAAVRYEPALSTFMENDAVAPFRGCTVDALLVSGGLFFCGCIGGLATTRAVSGGGIQGFGLAAGLFVPAFPVLELARLAAVCDLFAFRATLERGSPVSWDAAVGAESGGRFGSHFLLRVWASVSAKLDVCFLQKMSFFPLFAPFTEFGVLVIVERERAELRAEFGEGGTHGECRM
jgi:hypothetical protein